MSSLAIELNNICFTYPGQTKPCIKNLSLVVHEAERFGLFGPNGAGKTTLMHCMTGLLSPEQGSIQIGGQHIRNRNLVNRMFGFVPQDFSFYQELSPMENLAYFGALYGMKSDQIKNESSHVLDILGLADVAKKPVHKFSGGMKRRVNLAIGVMHKPSILFLDEPTVGVDIHSRHAIIQYLLELNNSGTTLIYTSHQLNEAEALCTTIALIDEGSILVNDRLPVILKEQGEKDLEGLFIKLTGKQFRDQ